MISGGKFTQAVGGGISQFATTMFNAVFFSGLEDVYHKPHSYYISRYPAGREATVYEGQIDLQWKNDSDTGVYVDTAWTPGTITVTFYGTKRYEIESISGNRTNVRAAGGAGGAGRRRVPPPGRRPGLRHHRHPGVQGPELRGGAQAGDLPDPLRRRADHPLRPAAPGRPGARRHDPGRDAGDRRTTSLGPARRPPPVAPTA